MSLLSPTQIKICGITRLRDALLACQLGAHWVGFIFAENSPRAIDRTDAREISATLAELFPQVRRVGVFQEQPPEEVIVTTKAAHLNAIQLHGNEDLAPYADSPLPILKMVPWQTDELNLSKALLTWLEAENHYLLLEKPKTTPFPNLTGPLPDKTFLAGGLTPQNVGELMQQFSPFGVDVASGVEAAPGVKDPKALQWFMETVLEATLAHGASRGPY